MKRSLANVSPICLRINPASLEFAQLMNGKGDYIPITGDPFAKFMGLCMDIMTLGRLNCATRTIPPPQTWPNRMAMIVLWLAQRL